MCLLIAQRIGAGAIPSEHLRTGWDESGNSHGAGYAFVDDYNRVVVRKPFWKLRRLLNSYARDYARYGSRSPFIVHLRFATHGKHIAENIHPHVVADGGAVFAHNGILSDFRPPNDTESDTVYFGRTALSPYNPDQLVSTTLRECMESLIGKANKLAFLTYKRDLSIVNEHCGVWRGGTWYSNDGYLPWNARYVPVRGGWGCGTSIFDDEDEWAQVREFDDAELFSLGYSDAATGDVSVDIDMLTDAQWRVYKDGAAEARAHLRICQ